MSTTPNDTSGPGTGEEQHVCPEGQVWDKDSGSCVTPPETPNNIEANFVDRIKNIMDEQIEALRRDLTTIIDAKMAGIVKEKEQQIEEGLRKSLGLDPDPVLRMSDLDKFIRKAQLKTAAPGKKTPKTADPGPEGTLLKTDNPITKLFNDFNQSKGIKP